MKFSDIKTELRRLLVLDQSMGEDDVDPIARLMVMALSGALVVFILWASIGQLEVVSVATGEIAPSSQLKQLSHLEGGIVGEILVAEGDQVRAGQPLLTLQATKSTADLGELSQRLLSLRFEILRLEAASDSKSEIQFPADLLKQYPDLAKEADAFFRSRRARLASELSGADEQIKQRQQEINGFRSRIQNDRHSLELLNEQIAISDDLLKKDLQNRFVHIDLLKQASELKGRINEAESALSRSNAALAEAHAQKAKVTAAFEEESRTQLDKARREFSELSQRTASFSDNLDRTVINAPVGGIVKKLYFVTQGGVIRPGAPVIDLVPSDDRLLVEAKLPPQNVGYVKVGDPAYVKLTSPDAALFGRLHAKVIHISPDTFTEEKIGTFYKVRLSVERDFFDGGGERYQLLPGVQVAVDIVTGTRSVMRYLFGPYLRQMSESMRER
ncbi:HlyD family type I secretion periplasmic adaptor subunit [Paramagnetospirillum magneticum]|uniref:Membrane fusion protein (MFP) family protein n=1 Tax=Paramagnetospirillum magneticum (strain ATCC 700264 / AMB-1) TaxID=342108 RepID=Q2W2G2_PARM1|nr:HlyD family type I secretion periplasmic adaptor subunit [Paramagnetospirillum magneticum]BAE51963.1 Membrane-fusion protein [Paramagnetospirillum magneticum AMB-1]